LHDAYEELVNEARENPDLAGNLRPNWTFLENLVIIDCYTLLARRDEVPDDRCKVISADPTNPHNLDSRYEAAHTYLREKGYTSLRVVFDSLSDFLALTDTLMGTKYLRHNMVWEEDSNIESLYMFRPKTLASEVEEYFLWFANSKLKLKGKKDPKDNYYLAAEFRGPFRGPIRFALDFEYNLIDAS